MKGRKSLEHLEKLWNAVLTQAEQKISKPSFDTWLKSTKLLAHNGTNVTISAPNSFARDWLEQYYIHMITGILNELTGEDLLIKFVVQKDQNSDDFELPPPITQAKSNEHADISPGMLNPKYTFDTFVIGSGNRFAHAASLAVAEAPAKAYNPFFIYGGVGLGKTHLMHAIGHYVKEHNPKANVVYLSSEKFTNEFINSIRARNLTGKGIGNIHKLFDTPHHHQVSHTTLHHLRIESDHFRFNKQIRIRCTILIHNECQSHRCRSHIIHCGNHMGSLRHSRERNGQSKK